MLREQVAEILDIFDKFGIPEDEQRRLFEHGLYFDFTYGDPDPNHINQHLTVFGVAILLKTCLDNNIRVNIHQLLNEPYMFRDEALVKQVAEAQHPRYRRISGLG